MQLSMTSNLKLIQDALENCASQVPFATSVALNKVADKSRLEVQKEMQRVFDGPTPWVLNSIRVIRSTKANLVAEVGFKDKNSAESSRTMVAPHVDGGTRHFKAMEARLLSMGLMPKGYNAVPGGAAAIDANGNMSQGQITQLLNVLGTYTESGYNKANSKTVARLAKGSVKKNTYGFMYWVNPVGNTGQGKHLLPGVYQRVKTGFGSSLKPVLIFVNQAEYKTRLDFYGIAGKVMDQEFAKEFHASFDMATRTALLKTQGTLL